MYLFNIDISQIRVFVINIWVSVFFLIKTFKYSHGWNLF